MKEKVNNLVLFDKVRRVSLAREEDMKKTRRSDLEGHQKPKKKLAHTTTSSTRPTPPLIKKQATYDKLIQEVPKYKMITPSILSDRLRINGSLARAAIRHLVDEGAIRPIVESHHQYIYTRATNA